MKRYFVALALSLTLGTIAVNAGPKHRHHPVATVVADSSNTGIEAYSDTSSVADSEDVAYDEPIYMDHDSDSDWEDVAVDRFLRHLFAGTVGTGGVLLAIVIVIFLFLLLLSPFIILALIIRFMLKKHNDRVTIAQQAMASGQPIPEAVKPVNKETDSFLWQKGVKNVSLGAGLALFFYFLGASPLVGIGLLVACLGVGQIYVAKKTSQRDNTNTDERQTPEF